MRLDTAEIILMHSLAPGLRLTFELQENGSCSA
jgi:hypothetical protein